jgi:Ca2+/Na+ antiporter
MSNFITGLFTWKHLSEAPTSPLYTEYFLYLIIFLFAVTIVVRIFFKIRGRSVAYRSFDRQWFWGLATFSALGLFVWFSVTQLLPTFGTRLAVYIWALSLLIYKVYLCLYYLKVTIKDVAKFNEKKRKEKYLK